MNMGELKTIVKELNYHGAIYSRPVFMNYNPKRFNSLFISVFDCERLFYSG